MPYLIDGHNLIGKMPDLNLDDLDDEIALIDRLESYFKGIRRKAIVFFDRGQPGNSKTIRKAFVQAHFISQPGIADKAITAHLKKLGGAARNYTVVSSDNEVRISAERFGARVLESSEFAFMLDVKNIGEEKKDITPDDDLDYWLDKFQGDS